MKFSIKKFSIKKKIFLLTAALSLAFIIVSIAVSSVIFMLKTRNDTLNLCKTSSLKISGVIEDEFSDFFSEYKEKIDKIYRENMDKIDLILNDGTVSYEEKSKYFSEITEGVFPPRTGFGLSYQMAQFNNSRNEVLRYIDLISSSDGMIGGYVVYYDEENENSVFLFDSTPPSSRDYNFPASFEKVGTRLKNEVFCSEVSVAFYESDLFGGFSPIKTQDGEIVAYCACYYSINRLVNSQMEFVFTLVATMLVATALMLTVYLIFANKYIVKNIKSLSESAIEFTSRLTRGGTLEIIDTNVKSHDEIGALSENFRLLQERIIGYVGEISEKTATEERMRAELGIASKIQLESLPEKPLMCKNVRIESFIRPAKEVGGDLFDYFMIDENRLFFVIADVSGKGVPAALFMMRGKEIIRSCASRGMNVVEIAQTVNNELCKNNKEGLFITAFIAIYDVNTKILTYVRAGHEQPFILRGGKAEKISEESNFILGGFPNFTYVSDTVQLCGGDRMLLYTDGLNEGINASNEEFGYERIEKALEDSNGEVLTSLYGKLCEFCGEKEQFDDVTMLLIEVAKEDVITLSPPTYDDIPKITDRINSQLCGDGEKIAELDVIIDELINNYVSYAFDGVAEPRLEISLKVLGGEVKMTFTDNGAPFDPIKSPDADVDVDVSQRKIGGLGIMIVKNISDGIEYSDAGGLNRLTVHKKIK